MARGKKKSKKVDKKDSEILSIRIPVPEEVEHLINHSDNCLSIRIDAASLSLVRKVASEFIAARSLPADPKTTSITDSVAMYIQQNRTYLSGTQAQQAAVHYYETQHVQANADASLVAYLDDNDLLNDPTPYEAWEVSDDVPSWRKGLEELSVPEPEKNLSNPYERRFKQLMDFVQEGGAVFMGDVLRAVNDGMGKAMVALGEDVDADGFPDESPGSPVHVLAGPKDANEGDDA